MATCVQPCPESYADRSRRPAVVVGNDRASHVTSPFSATRRQATTVSLHTTGLGRRQGGRGTGAAGAGRPAPVGEQLAANERRALVALAADALASHKHQIGAEDLQDRDADELPRCRIRQCISALASTGRWSGPMGPSTAVGSAPCPPGDDRGAGRAAPRRHPEADPSPAPAAARRRDHPTAPEAQDLRRRSRRGVRDPG
jgi:hypothetical protein